MALPSEPAAHFDILWSQVLPAEATGKSCITAQPEQREAEPGELTPARMILYKKVKVLAKGKRPQEVYTSLFLSHKSVAPFTHTAALYVTWLTLSDAASGGIIRDKAIVVAGSGGEVSLTF